MADYNQLNKTAPSKLDVLFAKNKEINNAILALIRTAYLNNHEETKERNKKLVDCLKKDAKILVDQLSDETFKENIKSKLTTLIKNNFKLSSDIQNKIKNDISELIESNSPKNKTTVKSKKVNIRKIDTLLNNKKFMSNLTKFSVGVLKQENATRIKVLTKAFDSVANIKTINQQIKSNTSNIVDSVTSGFNKLVSDFIDEKLSENNKKSLFTILQQKITERIDKTISYIKKVKNNLIKGISSIGKNLNPKGLLKLTAELTFGLVKLFNRLIFGIFKGVFSIVKGVFKLGINLVKGAFNIISTSIKTIFKVSKTIVNGIAKLSVGIITKLKAFLLTPKGAFITGYIVGFIYQKIKTKYDEISEKIHQVKKDMELKFHNMRMSLFKEIGENKTIKKFHDMLIIKERFSSLKIFMTKMTRALNGFSFKGVVASVGGGVIGGWVGRLVGTAVGSFLGPLGTLLGAGIGTALGYIAGKYIGQWLQGVPEKKDAQSQKDRNLIVSAITNKYKQKRQRQIQGVREKLKSKIEDIDNQIKNTKDDDPKKFKLQQERSKYQETLDAFTGRITINDESEEERYNNDKVIDKLSQMLTNETNEFINKEDGWFNTVKGSIFTGYKNGSINFDFNINEVFDNVNNGKTDIIAFPEIESGDKMAMNARNGLRILSMLKTNAIQCALDAYQKGRISFGEIQGFANKLLIQSLERGSVIINNKTYSIKDYLTNHLYSSVKGFGTVDSGGKNLSQSAFDNALFLDMQQQINDEYNLTDEQEQMVDQLTDKFIEQYKNISRSDLVESSRETIHNMFANFILKNKIKNNSDLSKNSEAFGKLKAQLSQVLTVDDKVEFEDNTATIDKILIGLKDTLMLKGVVDDKLNEEFEKESSEQLKKLNIIEKKKYEIDLTLEEAKKRNSFEKKKHRELSQKVIELQDKVRVTLIETGDKKVDPEFDVNKKSGLNDQ